jgi:1-acyl-sn-glycerol-3-phosphate acyltransferase
LDFSEHYGDARNAETLRKVTNEIMEAIRELSGQEYVDIYASAAKEALKERE